MNWCYVCYSLDVKGLLGHWCLFRRTARDGLGLRVYLGRAWSGGAPLSPLAGYDCASVYASSILMAQITYAACVAGEEPLCPCATCCLCVVTAAWIYYL